MQTDIAVQIVEDIIKNLSSQPGLGVAWDNLSEEYQKFIEKDWIDIVNKHMKEMYKVKVT